MRQYFAQVAVSVDFLLFIVFFSMTKLSFTTLGRYFCQNLLGNAWRVILLCIFVIYRYKKVFLKYLKSEKNGMFVFPYIYILFHIFVCRIFSHAVLLILHKKSSFPLRLSSVNATKSAVSCGFGRIY